MITSGGPRLTEAPPIGEVLAQRIEAAGSARAAASALGLSHSYVLDVRSDRRPPSKRLLAALGLRMAVVYAEGETARG